MQEYDSKLASAAKALGQLKRHLYIGIGNGAWAWVLGLHTIQAMEIHGSIPKEHKTVQCADACQILVQYVWNGNS